MCLVPIGSYLGFILMRFLLWDFFIFFELFFGKFVDRALSLFFRSFYCCDLLVLNIFNIGDLLFGLIFIWVFSSLFGCFEFEFKFVQSLKMWRFSSPCLSLSSIVPLSLPLNARCNSISLPLSFWQGLIAPDTLPPSSHIPQQFSPFPPISLYISSHSPPSSAIALIDFYSIFSSTPMSLLNHLFSLSIPDRGPLTLSFFLSSMDSQQFSLPLFFQAVSCQLFQMIIQTYLLNYYLNNFGSQIVMHPMIVRGLAKVQGQVQEQLMEAYQLFDNRNKGSIDANGLGDAMKVLGYQIDKKQVQQMIAVLDESGKGVITKEQFKKFMTARMDFRDDQEQLKQAFDYYDVAKKGRITSKELEKMAQEIGEQVSECPRMIFEADKDQDGVVSNEEFLRCIKKTSYY